MNYEDSYKAFGGKKLFCRELPPKDGVDPKCLVYICHGYGGHLGGLYDCLYECFHANDFFVFGHDHVGHGQSEGHRCWFENFDALVDPIKLHIEEVKNRFPGKKTFIYGHSLGGLASFRIAQTQPDLVDGVIAEGPYLGEERTPRWWRAFGSYFGRWRLLSSIPVAFFNPNDISRTQEVNDRYAKDPLSLNASATLKLASVTHQPLCAVHDDIKSLKVPFFIGHSPIDKMAPYSKSAELYQNADCFDKTLRRYEGGAHVLREEPFNKIGETFRTDVAEWINRRI